MNSSATDDKKQANLLTLEQIELRLEKATRRGDEVKACCPAHTDSTPSFGAKRFDSGVISCTCWAGCSGEKIAKALGLDADGVKINGNSIAYHPHGKSFEKYGKVEKRPGDDNKPNLYDIAQYVGISAFELHDRGVSTIEDTMGYTYGVQIAYQDADGTSCRPRVRIALQGKDKMRWSSKATAKPMICYGAYTMHHLKPTIARIYGECDHVVLVEGESDCWAAWNSYIPAIGIPGSTMCKLLRQQDVEPYKVVYVWQENDAAGTKFVTSCYHQLKELGFGGEIRVIHGDGVKDLCDLWRRSGFNTASFRKAVENIFGKAVDAEAFVNCPIPELTELAIANAVVAKEGHHLRYCESLRGWHTWNGKKWESNTDRSAEVRVWSLVERYLREKRRECEGVLDPVKRERAINSVRKFETAKAMGGILSLISKNQMVNTSAEKFDQYQFLFNCDNGVINLQTGELQPHDPELLLTKISPASYYPGKKSPLWDKVLADYWSADVQQYVQTVTGVTMTGCQAKLLLFLYGHGDNGKSTLVRAIQKAMGGYASTIQVESLMRKTQVSSGPSPDIAATRGTRMLVSTETAEGTPLDEQLIKQLTGGDIVNARHLHKESFDFIPQFTLWLQGNHKPTVIGTDDGIWTRLKLVPFTRQFTGEDKDSNLVKKLEDEPDAVLAWMVEGCLRYQREGIIEPDSIRAATEQYRRESDKVGEFVDEMLTYMPGQKVTKSAVYQIFAHWCKTNGYMKILSSKRFSQRLIEQKFVEGRTNKERLWLDWTINPEAASAM